MAGRTRKILAHRLKQLRKRHGCTQQAVAEKSGLDYKYYQTLEGKSPPNITLDSIERLAKAFSITPWQLLRP